MAWLLKGTIVSWRDTAGKYQSATRRGHWKEETVRRSAQRFGWALPLKITHYTSDLNGYPEENDDATDERCFTIS